MIRVAVPVAVTLLLSACTAAPDPAARDIAARALQAETAGRVALQPVNCVRSDLATSPRAIGDTTLFFGEGDKTYRMDSEGCSTVGRPGSILVTEVHGSQLCRGDLARVVDSQSHIQVGACRVTAFTPYKRQST